MLSPEELPLLRLGTPAGTFPALQTAGHSPPHSLFGSVTAGPLARVLRGTLSSPWGPQAQFRAGEGPRKAPAVRSLLLSWFARPDG